MADSIAGKKYTIEKAPSSPKEPGTMAELFARVKELQTYMMDRKRKGSELYRRLEAIEARLNDIEEYVAARKGNYPNG